MAVPRCSCTHHPAPARRIVLTGGPGAGKTAVLETVRRGFCEHVRVIQESASIIFGGGFPRNDSPPFQRAAQRAIYHVQRQLERLADDEGNAAIIICDRGTIDGSAYWPGEPTELWAEVQTRRALELARYDLVLHLHTPSLADGYQRTGMRDESLREAQRLDARIVEVWDGHPRRIMFEATPDFFDKVQHVLRILRSEVPACCREHRLRPAPAISRAPPGPVHS